MESHIKNSDTLGYEKSKDQTSGLSAWKIFCDPVHPHLRLPELCCKIINIPQFQRLKNLKQLGVSYYVYPSASHNRFEHCVGTSYLAGKYASILRQKQPELSITDQDILCLYVAGLCHDLGHGPFSHVWEDFQHDAGEKEFKHERMSLALLDSIFADLPETDKLSSRDITFVKELILGEPLSGKEFQGREPSKYFLYEIVSNAETKIDVDKFDYLLRDCRRLNVTTTFDYKRLMNNTKVVGYDDSGNYCEIAKNTRTKIVYQSKVSDTLENLFRDRFSLYRRVCQHRVTTTIEIMVRDGLKQANEHFEVPGETRTYSLSTAYQDARAFVKLTDSVFEQILHWNRGGAAAAKILEKVIQRKLYKFLGAFLGQIEEKKMEQLKNKVPNIKFGKTIINYGDNNVNPLNKVDFFEKSQPECLFKKKFPDAPEERRTFILYPGEDYVQPNANQKQRKIDPSYELEVVTKCVKAWATENDIYLEYE